MKKKFLILDTNIISRAGDRHLKNNALGDEIVDYLQDVLNRSQGWSIPIQESHSLSLLTDLI